MAGANAQRGEVALMLEGKEYVLRPSWEAIEAFEEATGKGVVVLAREALSGALRTREVAVVATECIRAWGRATNGSAAAVNADRVRELIGSEEGGIARAMQQVGALLVNAATGGYTPSGEAKPTGTA